MTKHLENAITLPNQLKGKGYRCLQTGKWWQGHYSRGGFTDGMTRGGRHGDDGLVIGRQTMAPITNLLDECKKDQTPFMIWYAPLMPHDPHTPPERLLDKYRDKTESIHVARYWAMVEWFDETVGQLMDELKRRDQFDNTIIVYIADNGWIQSPDNPRYAPRSKQSQYDGGLRTPIMIHWPNKVQPKNSDRLAQSIDIVPTLQKALGLPFDPTLPGIDLLDEKAVSSRTAIFGSCFTHNSNDLDEPSKNLRWRWMVEENKKLIVPNPILEPKAIVELYDLDDDPFEKKNLAESDSRQADALLEKLDTWWKPSN